MTITQYQTFATIQYLQTKINKKRLTTGWNLCGLPTSMGTGGGGGGGSTEIYLVH